MTPLIIITDSIPTADGGGISQTLFNLFDQWPGNISILVAEDEQVPKGNVLSARLHRCSYTRYKPWQNRFGRWVNPYLERLNFQYLCKHGFSIKDLPAHNDALVMVSTTVPIKLFAASLLQSKGAYKVIPYFMDDWLWQNALNWRGGNIQQVAKQLLESAPAWLMISKPLEQTLITRYQLAQKPCLIVHNPAPEIQKTKQTLEQGVDGDATYILIYAGSIWPMHADALEAVAKAVQLLHKKGFTTYQLHIYTAEAVWQHNRKQLEGPGVSYQGFIPYTGLQARLQQGWLLVVAASFMPQYQALSRSSVQTKLTDYMAAGKPVLYIGPADGASGQFVENWDCGFTISTPNPADIAERLQAISRMPEQYQRKANQALLHATTTFSKASVQQNLYAFLEQYAQA